MKSHESTHSDEKPYECKKCDYRGKSRQALNLHKRIHVSIEEFPYQCDICMKRFRQSPHYHTHMKMHLGIKPLKCQVCEYRTASRQNLKLHEQTHTKEEGKFQCLLCDKKFRRKFILDCHMVTHVEVNKDRFLCPLCDVTFSLKVSVQKHIRRMHRDTPLAGNIMELPSKENPASNLVNVEEILRELRECRQKNRNLNETIDNILEEMADMKEYIVRNEEKITQLNDDLDRVDEDVDGNSATIASVAVEVV